MANPLAIDLCCGLGGWTDGLIEEGYEVIGFDIERHVYGDHEYPAQLVLQNILTLDGAQIKDAALIVASPPCQKYSYMAMPWTRAKELAQWYREPAFPERIADLNALFNARFRIQREACDAAGRHIPMVVENVRGAIPWVGRSRWAFGSYHLWGDVPALMPATFKAQKVPGFRFDGSGKSFQTAAVQEGRKTARMNWSDQSLRGQDFTRIAGRQALHCDCENPEPTSGVALVSEECPVHNLYPQTPPDGVKVPGSAGRRTAPGLGARFTSRDCGIEAAEGRKGAGAGAEWFDQNLCTLSSRSNSRKAASAMIAKIPPRLSQWIAAIYKPERAA